MDTCAAFGLLQHRSLVGSGAAQLGGSVNGVGLEVLADGAKLVEALESDSGLPVFTHFGDRALSAVFIFCTVNNDCKGRLRHLSYGFMLSVLRGVYDKRAVSRRAGREPAPLSAVGGSAIDGQLLGPAFSVSVRGATVLWHIACCVRPRTLKCIIAKHRDQVEIMDVPYNHARGFGRMGLESPPAPAPYAWWCLLSCVILIVRQVAAYPFENDPRPLSASAAEEVYGTSFVMSDNNTGVKPDYSVVLAGVPAKAGITTTAFKAAAERRFGAAIMGTSFAADFPFASPRECIFAASKHNGKEPLQTVATDSLLKNEQALLSTQDLQQWLHSNRWETSQRLKAVAHATLQQHHIAGGRTMTSCTPSDLVSSVMSSDDTWTTQQEALSMRPMSHVFSVFDGSESLAARGVVVFVLRLLLRSIDGGDGAGADDEGDGDESEGDDGEGDGEGDDSNNDESDSDSDDSEQSSENSDGRDDTDGDENSEGSGEDNGEDDDED